MDEHCKHQYVVSLSGGKDSTAMLFMLLERGCRVDRIIYIDTTKEFPQMYEHLEEVQKRIPIQIETASFPFDYYFSEIVKSKGSHKGEKGLGWPTVWCRWCTAWKRDLFAKVLGKVSATVYIGLAADERRRVSRLPANKFAPLALWGVKERHALAYCKKLGFTWGGCMTRALPVFPVFAALCRVAIS